MKRTVAIAAASTVAGGIIAFSLASYASSSDGSSRSTSSGDPYTIAALDVADPSTPSSTPSTPSTSGAPAAPPAGRQFLHGERVAKDKEGKVITVDSQRGSVTATSATSLTVKSDDATTWTWTLTKDTKVRGANLKIEPASTIKVGDTVVVAGQRTGDTRTARLVADPPPNLNGLRPDLRKLRKDLERLRRELPH
jgi:hypothetical protein